MGGVASRGQGKLQRAAMCAALLVNAMPAWTATKQPVGQRVYRFERVFGGFCDNDVAKSIEAVKLYLFRVPSGIRIRIYIRIAEASVAHAGSALASHRHLRGQRTCTVYRYLV